ncbi:DUF134 domain-containing protein [Marinilabiliaceae bacterium JC017]|nr:DUF134 domain-containing protein [Marinilabiliaceae bacterium JC017]
MPRKKCCRRVDWSPGVYYFKPKGIPLRDLEEVVLSLDEMEAIRLVDLEQHYQEQAAEKMDISRQTLGRIVKEAHKKIARALTSGMAIRIEQTTESVH